MVFYKVGKKLVVIVHVFLKNACPDVCCGLKMLVWWQIIRNILGNCRKFKLSWQKIMKYKCREAILKK